MFEVISLLSVVKNYLPHSEPGPFGLLATLQLSCQTAPGSNYDLWALILKFGMKFSPIDFITRFGNHSNTVRTPGNGGWA